MPDDNPSFAISMRGVSLRRGEKWILRDIDWSVAPGTCAAILGPNGSGKSSLARIIAGYIWPTTGEVTVEGHAFGAVDMNALRKSIRLVQVAGPYDVDHELTAHEVVLTGRFGTIGLFDVPTDADRARATELLDHVGLSGVANHVYATLSGGERIRALIARTMMDDDVALLILDEPTAGLDLLAREQVLAVVEKTLARPDNHQTIVMITHHVEELPTATSNVLLLSEGQAAAYGSAAEVLRDDVLTRVYHCPVRVVADAGRYYLHVERV